MLVLPKVWQGESMDHIGLFQWSLNFEHCPLPQKDDSSMPCFQVRLWSRWCKKVSYWVENLGRFSHCPIFSSQNMWKSRPDLQFLCADCAEMGILGEERYDFCVDKVGIWEPTAWLLVKDPLHISFVDLNFFCRNASLSILNIWKPSWSIFRKSLNWHFESVVDLGSLDGRVRLILSSNPTRHLCGSRVAQWFVRYIAHWVSAWDITKTMGYNGWSQVFVGLEWDTWDERVSWKHFGSSITCDISEFPEDFVTEGQAQSFFTCLRKPGGKYLVISNGGIGSDVLKGTFSHVESEEIEGYACDLYYKLITVILCTKWCPRLGRVSG